MQLKLHVLILMLSVQPLFASDNTLGAKTSPIVAHSKALKPIDHPIARLIDSAKYLEEPIDLKAVQKALNDGVDPNAQIAEGSGHYSVVNYALAFRVPQGEFYTMMLKAGADPSVKDYKGRTALDHVAASVGSLNRKLASNILNGKPVTKEADRVEMLETVQKILESAHREKTENKKNESPSQGTV